MNKTNVASMTDTRDDPYRPGGEFGPIKSVDHPHTILARMETMETEVITLRTRVSHLEEWLDLLYRRVGIEYPGNEPAAAEKPGA